MSEVTKEIHFEPCGGKFLLPDSGAHQRCLAQPPGLLSELKNSTIITIAHRLNTVKDCDVILVLREGQVAELDTLNALLGRGGGIFSNMAASQNLCI